MGTITDETLAPSGDSSPAMANHATLPIVIGMTVMYAALNPP
jgi:hypothetical protein